VNKAILHGQKDAALEYCDELEEASVPGSWELMQVANLQGVIRKLK
jgi:hypothetical protein